MSDMNARDPGIDSKPFRSKHIKQIKLVKDLSWLDPDKLDGIEKEYEKILNSASDPSKYAARNRRSCSELRRRIELLRTLTGNKGNA